ncbi:MAG: hypothetical protein VB049_04950 [Candidatus Pelethousia sp.]|nr:hypothetical protein [Candidatus Pelethousia sp.]
MKIDILGTEYQLIFRDEHDDEALKTCGGYCDSFAKEIVVADWKPDESNPNETKNLAGAVRRNTRHEIIHAFFVESGLHINTMQHDGSWADNEEMVDWFAIQGPKIYAAWQEAGALC